MKDSRLTKKVYKEQKRLNSNNCWNSEIKNDLKELNINISEKQIGKLTSKEWKNMIINSITSLIQRDMKECNKTKLRLIKDNCFGKKEYIAHKDAANLLLLKLIMTDLKANYKENMKIPCAEGVELKKKTLNIYFIAKILKENL